MRKALLGLYILGLLLAGCSGSLAPGGAAAGAGASAASAPANGAAGGVLALNIHVLPVSGRNIRAADVIQIDSVVIDLLDPNTHQAARPSTVVNRDGQDQKTVTLDNVPLGNYLLRVQGRSGGQAAGGRFEFNVEVALGQTTQVDVPLTPTRTLNAIQVGPSGSLTVGATRQLTATGVFNDLTTQDLSSTATWTSANPAIASVSSTGLMTGVAGGQTTITATSSGVTGALLVTVVSVGPSPGPTQVTLKRVDVAPASLVLPPGGTSQLTATGVFSDSTTQDLTRSVTWVSLFPQVATVSSTGLVTARLPGRVNITATQGKVSGACSLNVTTTTVTRLSLTPANASLAKGSKLQLGATATFVDGATFNVTNQANWSSANIQVANVSSSGLVTSLATGNTSITATLGNSSAQANLTVTAPDVASIQIVPVNRTVSNGTIVQFGANATFSDGTTQNLTQTVTWTSTNTAVATIDNANGDRGNTTTLSTGNTVIEATVGAVSNATTLTVVPARLLQVQVAPSVALSNNTILVAQTVQYTATGAFDNGNTQDLTTQAVWSSSTPAVASISNLAGSQGLATGLTVGATAITATFGNLTGTAPLFVASNGPPSVAPPKGTLYVACKDVGFPTDFYLQFSPPPPGGNVAPARTVSGDQPDLDHPNQMALDTTRDILYVINQNSNKICVFQPASTFSGNVTPTRLVNPTSFVGGDSTSGIAIDTARDRLYVIKNAGNSSIDEFDNASTLNGGPVANTEFKDPALTTGVNLFYDSLNDRLYATFDGGGPGQNGVGVWNGVSTIGSGTVAANRILSPGSTQLRCPFVDTTANRLYVSDGGPGLFIWNNASTVAGATAADFSMGGLSNLVDPVQILIDFANNQLIVADGSNDDVLYYANPSAIVGEQTPSKTLSGAATTLKSAHGVALDPTR